MLGNLVKLSVLTGETGYREKADAILSVFGSEALQRPFQAERLLAYAEAALDGMQEIVIVGSEPGAMLQALYEQYRPNKLVARVETEAQMPSSPLFQGRTLVGGKTTAYVCRDFACRQPTTDPAELSSQLA
jgi:hypothetical protein